MIYNPKDLAAGLLFMGFGGVSIIVGSEYSIGTAARMGPGYFPRVLGGLLVALGAAIAMRALRSHGPGLEPGALAPVAIVLAAVVLFGLAAPYLGLIGSAFLVVVVASRANRAFRPAEAVVSGALLAAASVAVFVYGLGLQLEPWPAALRQP